LGDGVGIGLIALQLTWLVGARFASLFWEAPVGPTIALISACLAGAIVAIVAGKRLACKTLSERSPSITE